MQKLVLFDMDHTLVPADTGSKLMDYLYKRSLVTQERYLQRKQFQEHYHNGTLDVMAACKFDLNLVAEIEQMADKTILSNFFIEEIKPLITDKAINLVNTHIANGDYVVIITATTEEIARPVANFFGVNHLIGGKGERVNGILTNNLINGPCMQVGKLIHLTEWLNNCKLQFQYTMFYSDSHNDIPLLDFVDEAVIVDADTKLTEYAKTKNWRSISLLN